GPLEQLARVLPIAARDVPATVAALEHILGEDLGQRPRALEGVRIAADFDHRREGLAGTRVVERVEDQLGQAIPERKREGHGGATTWSGSTRVPAKRSWRARLSERMPAMMKPMQRMSAERKVAK